MTAKVFVDTNVLVYSRDASEPHKQAQAMAWMAIFGIPRRANSAIRF